MKGKSKYVTVRIPRELAEELDEIIQSGTHGYRSRAEIANEAIRLRLESLYDNNLKKNNMLQKK